MSLFFGYTVPGLYNELTRFRTLLARLPATSELRSVLEAELQRVEGNYKDQAVQLLHMLYEGWRGHPQPVGQPSVRLAYEYRETVLQLTEAGLGEWNLRGAALFEHFLDMPNGSRTMRNARGITLTFLK